MERARLEAMPPFRRTTGPATQQRIRATLRAALEWAIAQQLLTFNPAKHVKLAPGKRPKAVVWSDEHVARWRETGETPSAVMVWTPEQTGAFLHHVAGDRLYALWALIALRGLRRGEALGVEWRHLDLDRGLLTVDTTVIQDGWTPISSAPKTEDSAATIPLGPAMTAILRAHRVAQEKERAAREEQRLPWRDTGKVFVDEGGEWLHPEKGASERFRKLRASSGLPPISLRDLRHVAATLIHAAGGDLHTIKETLRHSSIQLTSDTYTSVLPKVAEESARAAEAIVPRARLSAEGQAALRRLQGLEAGGGAEGGVGRDGCSRIAHARTVRKCRSQGA
ncbi:site-specific integrase [Streptomyces sp. TRM70308]|uniref:site-specific integrase n=1 Tax=Streptomyces sp. TRM70308 TaxID=3131932 RepID=UPI003D0777B6